ncbi:DUF4157 domain-containing protein [Streptomyces sp. NPDC048603]|uniref:eCIS core domain-containing protein n=1 Tax=Streptomyces sp. NPDC048603 TaxID=3365577 RepID=UPI0037245916
MTGEPVREVLGRPVARLAAPDSAAEREAREWAGPLARGAPLPGRLSLDLTGIRVHTGPAAARSARALGVPAYTAGQDIVFGEGRFRPDTPAGRHLIAHELVHVAQNRPDTVHCFEAPEHQDFGDAGLVELEEYLRTPEGAAFARALGTADPAARIREDAFFRGRTFRVNGVPLTAGDLLAMGGDFYTSPEALMHADPGELTEIRDAIREERSGGLPGGRANERYQNITLKYIGRGKRAAADTFLGMAQVNAPHFTPTNRAAWKELHTRALRLARSAGGDPARIREALLVDAFGGHFLTDAFASGHLFDKKTLETQIALWVSRNQVTPANPEMRAYYAIVGADMPQLILKNIHDRLNTEGVEVTNRLGMSWRAFGDSHLAAGPQTLRVGAWAVLASRRQITDAAAGTAARSTAVRPGDRTVSPADDDALSERVLDLLPDQATVDRVTALAIGFIPAAARDITALIHRQRGAGMLELKARWGALGTLAAPVIGANLAVVSDPGREKDLLRLEEERGRDGRGPDAATQFRILEW